VSRRKRYVPVLELDEDDFPDLEGRTPPALLEIPIFNGVNGDWIAAYRFIMWPFDAYVPYVIGKQADMSREAALKEAFGTGSQRVAQARLWFLENVHLEGMQ